MKSWPTCRTKFCEPVAVLVTLNFPVQCILNVFKKFSPFLTCVKRVRKRVSLRMRQSRFLNGDFTI